MKKILYSKYFKIFLTIICSFIAIKMIDNYESSLTNIQNIINMIFPFIIGGVLAFFLSYMINFIEKKMNVKSRGLSILITYGLLIIFIIGFISFFVPHIVSNAKELISDIPQYISQSEYFFKNLDLSVFDSDFVSDKIKEILPTLLNIFNSMLNSLLTTTISFGKLMVNLVLGFIISIYILNDKENFLRSCKRLSNFFIGYKNTMIISNILKELKDNIGTYIIAKTLESFVLGVVSGIGYYLLGSKYALLFGFIAGITNMIPFYGPIIGALPVIVFNLFISIKVTISCIIFAIIIQQIESNLIEPMLIGNKMGVPAFLILLSITIGGGLFGITGMILAVPITAVIKNNLVRLMDIKENKLNQEM